MGELRRRIATVIGGVGIAILIGAVIGISLILLLDFYIKNY